MSTVNLIIARSLTNKEQQAIEKNGKPFSLKKKTKNLHFFFENNCRSYCTTY
jgi:hypothetical protein